MGDEMNMANSSFCVLYNMMSLCDAISTCLLCTSYLLPYILKVLQRKYRLFVLYELSLHEIDGSRAVYF